MASNSLTLSTTQRRYSSFTALESRVLVIYTGGTIGMMRNEDGALVPINGELEKRVRSFPQLHDSTYLIKHPHENFLCLPENQEIKRTLYRIKEYDRLIDSANMSVSDWVEIATDIKDNYSNYDGFVILHGTDTMSYTASALSFMMENLGKSVIITGSQIPIFEPRTDGTDNFVSALIIAAKAIVPEVCVFFGNNLFRGNRTTKLSANAFHAFVSPNCPPLAVTGINLQFNERLIFRPRQIEKFRVHNTLFEHVGLLRVFPSISATTVRAFLQPPIKGVVLQTYGSGNIPSDRKDLLEVLRKSVDSGVLILNITQCFQGSVATIYQTGKFLSDVGVICGYDMTPEAALTKLSYVLSKTCSSEEKQEMLTQSLRGELTKDGVDTGALDITLALNLEASWLLDSTAKELQEENNQAILLTQMTRAIVKDNIKEMASLVEMGLDVCIANTDGRTPLHHAATNGKPDMIKYLMEHGGNVHIKDRYGNTPLMDAILNDYHEAIIVLMNCGAHLTTSDKLRAGEDMCSAAGTGNIKRLQSYITAGADIDESDISGRTPLHVAVLNGQLQVVEFLLDKHANPDKKDSLHMTPLDYAKRIDDVEIINKLELIIFHKF